MEFLLFYKGKYDDFLVFFFVLRFEWNVLYWFLSKGG